MSYSFGNLKEQINTLCSSFSNHGASALDPKSWPALSSGGPMNYPSADFLNCRNLMDMRGYPKCKEPIPLSYLDKNKNFKTVEIYL